SGSTARNWNSFMLFPILLGTKHVPRNGCARRANLRCAIRDQRSSNPRRCLGGACLCQNRVWRAPPGFVIGLGYRLVVWSFGNDANDGAIPVGQQVCWLFFYCVCASALVFRADVVSAKSHALNLFEIELTNSPPIS